MSSWPLLEKFHESTVCMHNPDKTGQRTIVCQWWRFIDTWSHAQVQNKTAKDDINLEEFRFSPGWVPISFWVTRPPTSSLGRQEKSTSLVILKHWNTGKYSAGCYFDRVTFPEFLIIFWGGMIEIFAVSLHNLCPARAVNHQVWEYRPILLCFNSINVLTTPTRSNSTAIMSIKPLVVQGIASWSWLSFLSEWSSYSPKYHHLASFPDFKILQPVKFSRRLTQRGLSSGGRSPVLGLQIVRRTRMMDMDLKETEIRSDDDTKTNHTENRNEGVWFWK